MRRDMSMNTAMSLHLVSWAGMLAGCAWQPPPVAVQPTTRVISHPVPAASESDQLLSHVAKLRLLTLRESASERENARKLFQREESDFNRIRYALVLALTRAVDAGQSASAAMLQSTVAAQEDVELMNLLEPLLTGPAAATTPGGWEIRALATLLHSVISERRKIREQLRETQARLALARKDETRDAEARALRSRIEELETKLDVMKSIDRSVNRRAEVPRK